MLLFPVNAVVLCRKASTLSCLLLVNWRRTNYIYTCDDNADSLLAYFFRMLRIVEIETPHSSDRSFTGSPASYR